MLRLERKKAVPLSVFFQVALVHTRNVGSGVNVTRRLAMACPGCQSDGVRHVKLDHVDGTSLVGLHESFARVSCFGKSA